MKLACLVWIVVGGVAATGCKSSAECAKCSCDAATVAVAPASVAPGAPTGVREKESPTASADESAPAMAAAAAKCAAGEECESPGEGSGDPGRPPVRPDGPAVGPRPLVPPTGALAPVVVAPSGAALAPGLAAHLERLPATADMTLVLQADVRALLSAEDVRSAARSVADLLGREIPGDLSCAVELLASIELATVAIFESGGGHDSAAVILEGGADLPGILECAQRILRDELPRGLAEQAGRGYVEVDGEIALGTLGPRSIVIGEPELVQEMRVGRVRNPLSKSAEFTAARGVAGAGPVTVVAVVHDAQGSDDESFSGGATLRTSPRLEVVGSFAFAKLEMAGEVVEEFTEAVSELDQERARILRALNGMPGGSAVAGDVIDLLDAATDARLTIQGRHLSFEVRAPQGVTAASLAATAARAVPMLLLAEGHDEREAVAVPAVPAPGEPAVAPERITIE